MEQLKLYLFHRNDRVHRIKPNSKIAVRYFQHRRWQLVTFVERLSGFWPHQCKLQQYPLQLLHFFLFLTAFSALANKLREYVGVDLTNEVAIECCLLMLLFWSLLVKLILPSIHQYSRRKFYEKVVKHFETLNDPEEVAVLNKGAERGFKYSLCYICVISVGVLTFISIPVLRGFYGYFFYHELNMQIHGPLNYGIDHYKYWYIIAFDILACAYSALLVQSTHDMSFILQVRHESALFKIVRIRLRKASELADTGDETKIVSGEGADESYSLISSAIDLHSECFELVKLIEKSYSKNWFIVLLQSTASFGASIHLVSTKLHDSIETFRYVTGFMMVLLHFQVIFSQGQLIIDSAESVSDACCECKWYGLPKKTRKLLTMMMIRTTIPCQLTGAKLFPLSMESFSKMLKAGLSYYTVFRAKSR